MNNYLQSFSSNEFLGQVSYASSPSVLRHLIISTDAFQKAKEALHSGSLSEKTIQDYVDVAMRAFVPGKRFEHDFLLSAIVILFESHHTEFSEDFLHDLSRLSLAELQQPIQMAKESLNRRTLGMDVRTFTVSKKPAQIVYFVTHETKPQATRSDFSISQRAYA